VVLSFIVYCLSIVPGQSLMRDRVRDISWRLGNTAENGGVVLGVTFHRHLSKPYIWPVRSDLFDIIT
jgi:hypothetical protein